MKGVGSRWQFALSVCVRGVEAVVVQRVGVGVCDLGERGSGDLEVVLCELLKDPV